jgi:hypothetical protein
MFYNNTFVGNHIDLYEGDYTQATTLQELKSLIEQLTLNLDTFNRYDAPEELITPTQERLVQVIKYFISMGGSLTE